MILNTEKFNIKKIDDLLDNEVLDSSTIYYVPSTDSSGNLIDSYGGDNGKTIKIYNNKDYTLIAHAKSRISDDYKIINYGDYKADKGTININLKKENNKTTITNKDSGEELVSAEVVNIDGISLKHVEMKETFFIDFILGTGLDTTNYRSDSNFNYFYRAKKTEIGYCEYRKYHVYPYELSNLDLSNISITTSNINSKISNHIHQHNYGGVKDIYYCADITSVYPHISFNSDGTLKVDCVGSKCVSTTSYINTSDNGVESNYINSVRLTIDFIEKIIRKDGNKYYFTIQFKGKLPWLSKTFLSDIWEKEITNDLNNSFEQSFLIESKPGAKKLITYLSFKLLSDQKLKQKGKGAISREYPLESKSTNCRTQKNLDFFSNEDDIAKISNVFDSFLENIFSDDNTSKLYESLAGTTNNYNSSSVFYPIIRIGRNELDGSYITLDEAYLTLDNGSVNYIYTYYNITKDTIKTLFEPRINYFKQWKRKILMFLIGFGADHINGINPNKRKNTPIYGDITLDKLKEIAPVGCVYDVKNNEIVRDTEYCSLIKESYTARYGILFDNTKPSDEYTTTDFYVSIPISIDTEKSTNDEAIVASTFNGFVNYGGDQWTPRISKGREMSNSEELKGFTLSTSAMENMNSLNAASEINNYAFGNKVNNISLLIPDELNNAAFIIVPRFLAPEAKVGIKDETTGEVVGKKVINAFIKKNGELKRLVAAYGKDYDRQTYEISNATVEEKLW